MGIVLYAPDQVQVLRAFVGGFGGSVHDGCGTVQTQTMGLPDDLFPSSGSDLYRTDDIAYLIDKDLSSGPLHAAKTSRNQGLYHITNLHSLFPCDPVHLIG